MAKKQNMMGSDGLLGQMRQMQQQLKTAQKELEKEEIEAEVRNGAIKVVFTGGQICKSVHIDPELLKSVDAAALEKLMLEVTNKALEKVRKHTVKKLGPLAGMGH